MKPIYFLSRALLFALWMIVSVAPAMAQSQYIMQTRPYADGEVNNSFVYESGAKLYFKEDCIVYESETTTVEMPYDEVEVLELVVVEENPYEPSEIEKVENDDKSAMIVYSKASGELSVRGVDQVTSITVFAMNGMTAGSVKGKPSLNLSGVAKGVYLVIAETSAGTIVKKLAIN